MTERTLELGPAGHTVKVGWKDAPLDVEVWDGQVVLHQVGKPTRRIDAHHKVSGMSRYTTDIRLPGMLYGTIVRSPHPSAEIREIDDAGALTMPGVRGIHRLASKGDIVRFEGQEILAIAADSLHQAQDAARAVKVTYAVLPHVAELEQAMRDDSPVVYGKTSGVPGKNSLPVQGNVRGPATGGRRFAPTGDVSQAIVDAKVRVDLTFRTAVQTHSCLEPHGSVVRVTEDGGFEIWTSTQSIASVVSDVARAFSLQKSQVRVHCDYIGGGFGSKFGAGIYTMAAAHLARITKRPVRIVLDRRAEHLVGGNRPSSLQKVKLGASEDGTLTALEVRVWGSAGVGTGAGAASPYFTIYQCANRRSFEYDVFTNAGPAAAFRAPGHPQGVFALEGAMDQLSQKLGMDPIEVRLRNDPHPTRRLQWDIARKHADWDRLRKMWPARVGDIVRGIGAASSVWYNVVELGVGATVEVYRDGGVVVLSAVQDIGGGIRTVLAQVVAEVFGLQAEQISVKIGDSVWPLGPGSGGSKTTASLTPAVHQAAIVARKKLAAAVAHSLSVPAEDLRFHEGKVVDKAGEILTDFRSAAAKMRAEKIVGHGERTDDMPGISAAKEEPLRALATTIGGVQIAQVAVNIGTGVVTVEKIVAVHDCGRVMNPLQAASQVRGGVIQGIGYALFEERLLDKTTGRMLNPNLESYKIPTIANAPEIDVHFVDVYSGLNSTGAMGLGEPATVPTAAAIANAVFHATGIHPAELPMTPERLLKTWRDGGLLSE